MYVIHCAGIVDIKSEYDPAVYSVNVQGTRIMAELSKKIGARMVYISSVHAMPPAKGETPMPPAEHFDPDTVMGLYSKTKARASQIVMDMVKDGLDAVIVQPSGLIGPNDFDNTNMSEFFYEAASGKLPACVKAGYNFIDVRDAAAMIISACKHGTSGQSYLAANKTVSMMTLAQMAAHFNNTKPVSIEVPLEAVTLAAPIAGLYYKISRQKPLFTAFAAQTLRTDSNFDISKSVAELGLTLRPVEETVEDIIRFQQSIFRLDADDILINHQPVRKNESSNKWMLAAGAAGAAALVLALKKRR